VRRDLQQMLAAETLRLVQASGDSKAPLRRHWNLSLYLFRGAQASAYASSSMCGARISRRRAKRGYFSSALRA
jgi:hypothetical protein